MNAVLTAVIDIDATPDTVWDVLTDFAAYGQWSNFSTAAGTARAGTRLTMRMPGMSFRPTVTVATPGQELRWVGTLGVQQLFRGQHSFVLTPNDDGTTRLTNREEFSGALATLTRPLLRTPKNDGYAAFNKALKQRVEGRRSQDTATTTSAANSPSMTAASLGITVMTANVISPPPRATQQ